MKKIQDVSAYIFIICVFVLTVVSILGIWKIFNTDVIGKSIKTIGLLAIVSVIVIIAARFIGNRNEGETNSDTTIKPLFIGTRQATVAILISSVALLALLAVLAIWDILAGEVLSKSFSSMGVIVFASFVIIITCLQREEHEFMHKKISSWVILLIIILGWVLLKAMFWSIF